MSRTHCLILLFCLPFISAHCWDIVRDNRAQAAIILPESPYPVETYAAEELQYIISRASGVELPLATAATAPQTMTKAIRLGRAAELELDSLPLCGFRVQSTEHALLLAGRDTDGPVEQRRTAAGTLYAVYEWAEEQLGVRWLWPDETGVEIPARGVVSTGQYDLRQEPALEFAFVRRFDWRWGRRILRTDTSRYIRFAGCPSQGHAFINWYKIYGADHPEYFEMDSQGRRLNDRYGSMCVSNPAFHQQIIDNWVKSKRTDMAVNAKENDAHGRCQCPQCLAWDGDDQRWPTVYYTSHRNVGERYAKFYRAIWEKASQINPDVRVGAYAYMNYVYAPRKTKLHKNIVVGLVDDLPFPRTKAYQDLVDAEIIAWGDSGASLYMRPNFTLSSYAMPELYYNQYAHQFKTAYKNGMLGLDIDGPNMSWATIGLNLYVLGRLVVKPERPVEELVSEYCAAFGPAANAVRKYFDYWEKYTMDNADYFNHVHETKTERRWFFYGFHYTSVAHLLFPDKVFPPAGEFLAEAERLSAGNQIAARRVQFLRQGFEHARLCSQTSEIFANPDNDNVVRQRALARVKTFRENILPNVADLSYFSGRGGRLEGAFWKMIDVDLRNALSLPESWQGSIETAEEGRAQGYFQKDFDDRAWKPFSTWQFLEDQGVVEYRTAWYRTSINIPEEHAKSRVILRLGAVDESGWYWVNGREIGKLIYDPILNPSSWREPQEYDITDAVQFGKDNQITVLIENRSGKGGLWRPSFIRFELAGTGNVFLPKFPAPEKYAKKITTADETEILQLFGKPDLGKENAWLKVIAPTTFENPGGKTFRLQADLTAKNLGAGEFWLVIRQISATGQTLTYDGILIKKDQDWQSMTKDVKVRKDAQKLALFAVGVNMPEGAVAQVKKAMIEEMQ